MPQISRDQEIGAGSIGTFQEPIVIGIASDLARRVGVTV